MRKDVETLLYRVLKEDENIRKVTSFVEIYGVARSRGRELNESIDINTVEGLSLLAELKKEIMPDDKTPLKISEEDDMHYLLSPDEAKGIIFVDEEDVQRLFLNLEQTIEEVKENENKIGGRKR